tara:strand:+ start:1212 stop:2447 length:1236 start_codon:yes stop_codon:yes gene_type:complete
MNIGLSFILGLFAAIVSIYFVEVWWPLSLVIGISSWLLFGLFQFKMDSFFTILYCSSLVFCISFFGMIKYSHDQLSSLQFSETVDETGLSFRYPLQMSSQVERGQNVYRSVGCYACHTQQITHDDVKFDIKAKTSTESYDAVKDALKRFYDVIGRKSSSGSVLGFPIAEWELVAQDLTTSQASKARAILTKAGASLDIQVRFTGEDLMADDYFNPEGRGWGKRRSVARDYIFTERPMLGKTRVGPDLANIGSRQSEDVMLRRLFKRHQFLFEEFEGPESENTVTLNSGDKSIEVTIDNEDGYSLGNGLLIKINSLPNDVASGDVLYFSNGGVFTIISGAVAGAKTLSGDLSEAGLINNEKGKTISKNYFRPTQEALDLVAYLSSLKGANYPLDEAPIYQPFSSSIPEDKKD